MIKNIIYILLFIVVACKQPSATADSSAVTEAPAAANSTKQAEPPSSAPQKQDNSRYYTQQDTLVITTEIGETLRFSKAEFNKIVDERSEFFSEFINNPDIEYANCRCFGSEAGQDSYYILYAYFLKKRNGIEKYKERRKKMIDIYENINYLFGRLQYGGTYFGHQYMRILGYVEYDIYAFSYSEKYIEKTYNIEKQKELYIQSLRQLCADEMSIDYNMSGSPQAQRERAAELNKYINKIESLITDLSYLRYAQAFQYENYLYL